MFKKLKFKIPAWLKVLFSCFFLVVLALLIGIESGAFTGFPKGYDSFDHLAVIRIIRDNFPHIFWNPYWDEGAVLFPRNYLPLYHFSLGILAKVFPVDLAALLKWTTATNLILTSLFLFLIVCLLARDILAALISGIFYLASSGVWFCIFTTGLYSWIFAMMVLSLAIFALVFYLGKGKEKNWSYFLVTFSFSLVFLSHFLAVIFLGIFLFLLFLALKKSLKEKILYMAKILLPAILLVAFFYLPFFFLTSAHIMGEVGKEVYESPSFLSLFKQGYPGFPFFSVPLAFFLFLVIFFTRGKIKGKLALKFFWIFFALGFACLFYTLGLYRHFFSGISPPHFFLPTVFFLAPFLGLGLAFFVQMKITHRFTLLVVVTVLVAISLSQISLLKKNANDQSLHWPKLSFSSLDEERLFRFGHRDEILGGAFNFYSPTLQARGYWEPGEEGVFAWSNNLEETKWLLDWFGVKGLYLAKQGAALGKLFGQKWLSPLGQEEYLYEEARPIILATKTPLILFQKKDEEYFPFLRELAKMGLDSRILIPIKSKTAKVSDFSAQVVASPKEAEGLAMAELTNQKPRFVHSQKREVELLAKFTGVLLKENYFPNWRAYLEGQNKKGRVPREKLPIYLAGPGMMYASLPKDYQFPAKVVFEYRPGWFEKIGVLISLLTFLGLMLKLFIFKKFKIAFFR